MRGSAGDRLINLRKGDIGIFRLSECASFDLRQCSLLCVVVPQAMLDAAANGRILREGQLPCKMMSKHLQSLVVSLPSKDDRQADAMATATTSLLQLCLDFTADIGHDAAANELRNAVMRHIDENLDDTNLRPASLCEKFNVSRTWMYETFSSYGGITRYIRDKRLDAAFRDLCEGSWQRIIDIAYRRGFPSERQFQRAFLARFGVQPRTVRDRRKGGSFARGKPHAPDAG
jgi:AraC-like DNA-binding protein